MPYNYYAIRLKKLAKQYTALKKQLKKADTNPDTEIVGVTGFAFMERTIKASDLSTPVINGLTETVDSSSYPDRAVITLTNALGYNAYITNFIIDGQPITRYKGALVSDRLRRDDDIRRNGESLFELGNEYVITATQVDRLADYWFKNLGKKKHLYAVEVKGFAPWYSPGDWYTLTVGSAGTNENIASTVECYDVQCSRTAGDIGSTTLLLREVEENWTKTTFYAARAVTSGSPKRRSQQSNTLIVAASTFDGTYDYKCDGTDDDVEIQAAIDYVYYTWGGGEIKLTEGTFKVTTAIILRAKCRLLGAGQDSAIIERDGDIYGIYIVGTDGSEVAGFEINGLTVNNKSGETSVKALIYCNYVKEFVIDKCKAYGAEGSGVYVGYGISGIITNITGTYCAQSASAGYAGISLYRATGVMISQCSTKVNGDSGSANGEGIYINQAYDCSIIGCVATNNYNNGIYLYSLCFNTRVSACTCSNNGNNGIVGDGLYDSSITGNTCKDNTYDGIVLTTSASRNIITGNNTSNNAAYGILVNGAGCTKNVITGNRSYNNSTSNFTDTGTGTVNSGNELT